jgi:aldehyde dehydrogenase (NAD+)
MDTSAGWTARHGVPWRPRTRRVPTWHCGPVSATGAGFADVDNRQTIAQEEIFGPVLVVTPYDDVDDAVRIANDSDFGLAGTVWTQDRERGIAVARRVDSGTLGVNTYMTDPVAPFAGIKASGLGAELGPEGLAHFQRMKSIYT